MKRPFLYSLLCAMLFLGALPTRATAQDTFDLFGYGAETKAHAGAGIVGSRGPSSNYYNPANLSKSGSLDPYFQLDLARVEYTYTYPDYVPIKVRRWVPLPYLGLAGNIQKKFAWGVSLIPLPSSAGDQKVDGLPTRLLSSDADADTEPQIVDIEQSGTGFGYKLSLGGSYEIVKGFTAGLSLLMDSAGTETKVMDDESGTTVSEIKTESSSQQFILGTRGSLMKGKIVTTFALKLPQKKKITGETAIPVFGPEAVVDTSRTEEGPMSYGLGVQGVVGRYRPFFQFERAEWSKKRDQKTFVGITEVSYDYFDTNHLVLGCGYQMKGSSLVGAFGQYQSHLGEGILAKESADEEELAGMQFQDLGGIPHSRFAFGYRAKFKGGYYQTGFSYLTGNRDVWDKARGYGNYELKIYTLIAGGVYRF